MDRPGGFRSAQVRAQDDRAQCWNRGIPYKQSLCPVVVCPYLCGSDTVCSHNFNSHRIEVSVSNPISKYIELCVKPE